MLYGTRYISAPSGPPLDVEVKAIGSQKLQVSWKVFTLYYVLKFGDFIFSFENEMQC